MSFKVKPGLGQGIRVLKSMLNTNAESLGRVEEILTPKLTSLRLTVNWSAPVIQRGWDYEPEAYLYRICGFIPGLPRLYIKVKENKRYFSATLEEG